MPTADKAALKKQSIYCDTANSVHNFTSITTDPTVGEIYEFEDGVTDVSYLYNNDYLFTLQARMRLVRKANEIVFMYGYFVTVGPHSQAKKVTTKTTYGVAIYCQLRDAAGNPFGGVFEAVPFHSNCSLKFGSIDYGAGTKLFQKSQPRPLGTNLADVKSVMIGYRQDGKDQVDILF